MRKGVVYLCNKVFMENHVQSTSFINTCCRCVLLKEHLRNNLSV